MTDREEWAQRVVRENPAFFVPDEMPDEIVTWTCEECNETISGVAGAIGVCGYCGEWQDAPDGSGLRYAD
jgi:hypothetical protein